MPRRPGRSATGSTAPPREPRVPTPAHRLVLHAFPRLLRADLRDRDGGRPRAVPEACPAGGRILDVGCGSGRDNKRFAALGYAVAARDRSREIAGEATRRTGLAVRVVDVLEMTDLDAFDGIWACALRPGGAIYSSLKSGAARGRLRRPRPSLLEPETREPEHPRKRDTPVLRRVDRGGWTAEVAALIQSNLAAGMWARPI